LSQTLSKKGGQWDHEPRIRPIWGTKNRLGNRGLVYHYDGWSNIHFGYVARKGGFSQEKALNGAEWAQLLDQLSGKDDPADIQAIKEGYALGGSSSVSIQDVIQIFERNPQWEGR
jgi:Bacterial toxin 44